LKITNPKTCN